MNTDWIFGAALVSIFTMLMGIAHWEDGNRMNRQPWRDQGKGAAAAALFALVAAMIAFVLLRVRVVIL